MSRLPQTSDISGSGRHFAFVPTADLPATGRDHLGLQFSVAFANKFQGVVHAQCRTERGATVRLQRQANARFHEPSIVEGWRALVGVERGIARLIDRRKPPQDPGSGPS
jgi:hypothetical protein